MQAGNRVLQVCGGTTIFDHLSDWALIVEALVRLGDEKVHQLLGIKKNQLNVWRSRGRDITVKQRRALIEALDQSMAEAERFPVRVMDALTRIEAALQGAPRTGTNTTTDLPGGGARSGLQQGETASAGGGRGKK